MLKKFPNCGLVIDGMALVRQAQHIGLTYNKLAGTILQRAFCLMSIN